MHFTKSKNTNRNNDRNENRERFHRKISRQIHQNVCEMSLLLETEPKVWIHHAKISSRQYQTSHRRKNNCFPVLHKIRARVLHKIQKETWKQTRERYSRTSTSRHNESSEFFEKFSAENCRFEYGCCPRSRIRYSDSNFFSPSSWTLFIWQRRPSRRSANRKKSQIPPWKSNFRRFGKAEKTSDEKSAMNPKHISMWVTWRQMSAFIRSDDITKKKKAKTWQTNWTHLICMNDTCWACEQVPSQRTKRNEMRKFIHGFEKKFNAFVGQCHVFPTTQEEMKGRIETKLKNGDTCTKLKDKKSVSEKTKHTKSDQKLSAILSHEAPPRRTQT